METVYFFFKIKSMSVLGF